MAGGKIAGASVAFNIEARELWNNLVYTELPPDSWVSLRAFAPRFLIPES